MAAWSKAVLQKLEASGPAGALAEPIESSSPQPSSAEEFGIESSVTEPVSGGPPAHWLERVRQGAPQLLRSVPQRNKRTRLAPSSAPPLAEKTAALPQVAEQEHEEPSRLSGPLGEKELAPQSRPASKPGKRAETGVACSISEQSMQHPEPAYPGTPRQKPSTGVPASRSQPKVTPQPFLSPARPQSSSSAALAKFPTERIIEQSPKSLRASPAQSHTEPVPNRSAGPVERSSGASHEPLRVTAPPPPAYTDATFAPQRKQRRTTSLSCLEGPVKAAPAAGSLSIPQEPSEDHWPQLPEAAPVDPSNEPLATIRERERLRRLDDEQRGIYGTRRISA